MKVTISGLVHEVDWGDGKKEYRLFGCDMTDNYYTAICQADVEVEIPDNFDPRPQKIAKLREKERALRAEFAKSVTEIQARIAELSAIEYVQEL
jgi:hypothetical protein